MIGGAAMPGKQVFRAAGKPDHLVREDGPADEHVVVLDDEPVQRDVDVLFETAAREVRDLARRNRAELDERGRVVPAMIEDVVGAGAAVHDRAAQMARELLVAHRRVRAERDEDIERGGARAEVAVEIRSKTAGTGIVRVPSGITSRTRLPSSGSRARPSRTTASSAAGDRTPWSRPVPTTLTVPLYQTVLAELQALRGRTRPFATKRLALVRNGIGDLL